MSSVAITQNGISPGEIMERVLAAGDLSKLTAEQRAQYIVRVCESSGLNPLTRPFDIITLNGKPTLYASKGATDQLRRLHGITLRVVDQQRIEDVWQVTVEATTPDGRTDTDIGVVAIGGAKGEALANALMKSVTKAKRRVTLSICGLGLLDESELDTIPARAFGGDSPERPYNAPQAQQSRPAPIPAPADVDPSTGEIAPAGQNADQQKIALGSAIRELRLKLGWDEANVRAEAKRQAVSLSTVAGLVAMVGVLEGYVNTVETLEDEDDDGEPEQGTLIEAETAPIDRWAD